MRGGGANKASDGGEKNSGEEFPGKNLQIEYNLINLPQSISNSDGSTTYYGYLSDGTQVTCYSTALTAIGHAQYRRSLYRVGRDKARLSSSVR